MIAATNTEMKPNDSISELHVVNRNVNTTELNIPTKVGTTATSLLMWCECVCVYDSVAIQPYIHVCVCIFRDWEGYLAFKCS